MSRFDLCVIGAGPGGYAAAMRAWDFGKNVCLIEQSDLGGAGVHNGALSSKTMWELSRDYQIALKRDHGYEAENVVVDFSRVVDCVEAAANEKVHQLSEQLKRLSKPHNNHTGSITLAKGAARFEDSNLVIVNNEDTGETQTIEADNFVIATGSTPRKLESIPVDGQRIMTSDHVMNMPDFPQSMVILGAGVVGCEFATILANFGKTKVYMIDRAPRILPFEDEEVAHLCAANLEAKGVTIHHRAQLQSMRVVDGQVEYTIKHHTGGQESIYVERALISIGRVPNTGDLELGKAGIEVDDRGYIVDNETRTTTPNIYAVGDVTFDMALVSIADLEARHAVAKMFGQDPAPVKYDNLSTIMFLDPEVAAIGMNEQTAQQNRIPYRVAVYSYSLVNRPIAMRATGGFIKLLVTDDDEMKVLGMRALGVHASTTIQVVSLMMRHGLPVRDLAELFHPHPSVPEGLQDCVRMLLGTSVLKPNVFQSRLRLSRITYD